MESVPLGRKEHVSSSTRPQHQIHQHEHHPYHHQNHQNQQHQQHQHHHQHQQQHQHQQHQHQQHQHQNSHQHPPQSSSPIQHGQREADNDPPYSRVFIICAKTLEEKEILKHFSQFGTIQYCKLLREKSTQESKGLCYVKYEKSSSAAKAIENLNGQQITEDSPPLKVMIAEPKGSRSFRYTSNEPEDLPPRSRLYVICSKELSEEELVHTFEEYPEMEYCKMIRDRNTNEPKGFAFVKFSKSSVAVQAMEEINESDGIKIKVLLAKPKNKREGRKGSLGVEVQGHPYTHMTQNPSVPFSNSYPYPDFALSPYAFPPYQLPRQRLFVVCHKSATQEQLMRLFSRFPGMEYLDLKKSRQTGGSKGFAYVNYSTPQAALMAKQHLDGIEFPPGCILKVLFAEPLGIPKQVIHGDLSGVGSRNDTSSYVQGTLNYTGGRDPHFPHSINQPVHHYPKQTRKKNKYP